MTDTRENLIHTAIQLFLGKGYGVVGTSEICRIAKVNKGTIYHYFPTKSDLLIAAIEQYADEFNKMFEKIVNSKEAPRDKLLRLFDVPRKANLKWKKEHGFSQGCLVGNMSLELGAVDESVRLTVGEAMSSWRKTIEPLIEELIEADEIPAVNSEKGAEIIIGLIQGGLVLAKAYNDPDRISQIGKGAFGALEALAQ